MESNIFNSDKGFTEGITLSSNLEENYKKELDIDLDQYSDEELLTIRAMVDERLPVTKLKHINLHQESVIQYMQSRKLLNDIMGDTSVPPNQKAQVNNSVQSNLAYLDRMQKETYTSERNKQLENLVVNYINEMPDNEAKKTFLDELARRMGEI